LKSVCTLSGVSVSTSSSKLKGAHNKFSSAEDELESDSEFQLAAYSEDSDDDRYAGLLDSSLFTIPFSLFFSAFLFFFFSFFLFFFLCSL
jgi:hypothetical protein